MLRVKICGLTRYQDARLAADLGAWGLGFIFAADSPRACTVVQAKEIIRRLPGQVQKVGVFVNEPVEQVNRIVAQTGLTVAQLHGMETPDDCRRITVPVVKAIQNFDCSDSALLDQYRCLLLMDAPRVGDDWGGTGHEADWHMARSVAAKYPLFLAGNLGAANIERAIESVEPLGVDLSSSIEKSPGIKDHQRLRNLFQLLKKYI